VSRSHRRWEFWIEWDYSEVLPLPAERRGGRVLATHHAAEGKLYEEPGQPPNVVVTTEGVVRDVMLVRTTPAGGFGTTTWVKTFTIYPFLVFDQTGTWSAALLRRRGPGGRRLWRLSYTVTHVGGRRVEPVRWRWRGEETDCVIVPPPPRS
jgi:hypothetical protein